MRPRITSFVIALALALSAALAANGPAAAAAPDPDTTVYRWHDPARDYTHLWRVAPATMRKFDLRLVVLRVVRTGPRPSVSVDYRFPAFIGRTGHPLRQGFIVQLWVNDHDGGYPLDRYLAFRTNTNRDRPFVEMENDDETITRVPCPDARQRRVAPGHFRMSVPLECLNEHGFTHGYLSTTATLDGGPRDLDKDDTPKTYAFDNGDDGHSRGGHTRTPDVALEPVG